MKLAEGDRVIAVTTAKKSPDEPGEAPEGAAEESETPGAQIDLLIDRRDQVINLCEIKYATDEYLIDKDDEASLRNKIERLRKATKNRKSIQMTMITTYGVKQDMYSSIMQNEVTMDDLFTFV